MNPVHLRTFLAVRKHMNYTRAAADLYLTQPAVSRQIRQLEQELGLRLFEQIGKTLYVTDAGQTLAAEAEQLLAQMERAAEKVQAHGALARGRLSIGASSTPGLYLLPAVIGEFCAAHPRVELHYRVENSRVIEQAVLRNELDLGFIGTAPSVDTVVAERLLEDRITFFDAAGHPLSRRKALDVRDLTQHTWIIREPGAGTRQLVESRLKRLKAAPHHCIEMTCPEGVKALVAAGVGLSYMSLHGLRDDLSARRFTPLKVRDFAARRSIYMTRHQDKHVSPVMAAFEKLARSRLASG